MSACGVCCTDKVQIESLNCSTEIPQLGHQVGTRTVILKCDATEQDHAYRKKANKAPSRVISWTKGNFLPKYIGKTFHSGTLDQNLCSQHPHNSHLL